jgi:hypothetical protein
VVSAGPIAGPAEGRGTVERVPALRLWGEDGVGLMVALPVTTGSPVREGVDER